MSTLTEHYRPPKDAADTIMDQSIDEKTSYLNFSLVNADPLAALQTLVEKAFIGDTGDELITKLVTLTDRRSSALYTSHSAIRIQPLKDRSIPMPWSSMDGPPISTWTTWIFPTISP